MVDTEECEIRIRRIRQMSDETERQQHYVDAMNVENQRQIENNHQFFLKNAKGWRHRAALMTICGIIAVAFALGDKFFLMRYFLLPMGVYALVDALFSFEQSQASQAMIPKE